MIEFGIGRIYNKLICLRGTFVELIISCQALVL